MTEDLPTAPRLSLLLRLLLQHYSAGVQAALVDQGFDDVTAAQAQLFPFLPQDGIAVARLSERVGIRKQSVAELVRQLETAGYVERRTNPSDRRSQLVLLTARGRRAAPVAIEAGTRVEQGWAGATSGLAVEELRQKLRELLVAVERGAIEKEPDPGR